MGRKAEEEECQKSEEKEEAEKESGESEEGKRMKVRKLIRFAAGALTVCALVSGAAVSAAAAPHGWPEDEIAGEGRNVSHITRAAGRRLTASPAEALRGEAARNEASEEAGAPSGLVEDNMKGATASDAELKMRLAAEGHEAAENVLLTFDPNGGEGAQIQKTVKKGAKIEVPENSFTPPTAAWRKIFSHWTLQGDESVKLRPGEKLLAERDMTLLAVWRDAKQYTVTIRYAYSPRGKKSPIKLRWVQEGTKLGEALGKQEIMQNGGKLMTRVLINGMGSVNLYHRRFRVDGRRVTPEELKNMTVGSDLNIDADYDQRIRLVALVFDGREEGKQFSDELRLADHRLYPKEGPPVSISFGAPVEILESEPMVGPPGKIKRIKFAGEGDCYLTDINGNPGFKGGTYDYSQAFRNTTLFQHAVGGGWNGQLEEKIFTGITCYAGEFVVKVSDASEDKPKTVKVRMKYQMPIEREKIGGVEPERKEYEKIFNLSVKKAPLTVSMRRSSANTSESPADKNFSWSWYGGRYPTCVSGASKQEDWMVLRKSVGLGRCTLTPEPEELEGYELRVSGSGLGGDRKGESDPFVLEYIKKLRFIFDAGAAGARIKDPNTPEGLLKREVTVLHGESFDSRETPEVLPLPGKSFVGWKQQGDPDGRIVKFDNLKAEKAEDRVYIPVFEAERPAEYSVHFRANGGSGAMADVTVTAGERLRFPANGFTAPEGKEFSHWIVEGDPAGAVYYPGGELVISGEKTVLAVWKEKAGGGVATPDKPAKPGTPDKPGTPGKPEMPDKPAKPGAPAQPDKPAKPGHSGGAHTGGSGGSGGGGGSRRPATSAKSNDQIYGEPNSSVQNGSVGGQWTLIDEKTHRWTYRTAGGVLAKKGWMYIENPYAGDRGRRFSWFSFDEAGIMRFGWIQGGSGAWYHGNEVSDGNLGALDYGWYLDKADGRWYYLDPKSGQMKHGWQNIADRYYYFHEEKLPGEQGGVHGKGDGRIPEGAPRPYGSMYRDELTPDGYRVNAGGAYEK